MRKAVKLERPRFCVIHTGAEKRVDSRAWWVCSNISNVHVWFGTEFVGGEEKTRGSVGKTISTA